MNGFFLFVRFQRATVARLLHFIESNVYCNGFERFDTVKLKGYANMNKLSIKKKNDHFR